MFHKLMSEIDVHIISEDDLNEQHSLYQGSVDADAASLVWSFFDDSLGRDVLLDAATSRRLDAALLEGVPRLALSSSVFVDLGSRTMRHVDDLEYCARLRQLPASPELLSCASAGSASATSLRLDDVAASPEVLSERSAAFSGAELSRRLADAAFSARLRIVLVPGSGVDDDGVRLLARRCPQLEALDLSDCAHVLRLCGGSALKMQKKALFFPALRTLLLRGCASLRELRVRAPALVGLDLTGACARLEAFELTAPALRRRPDFAGAPCSRAFAVAIEEHVRAGRAREVARLHALGGDVRGALGGASVLCHAAAGGHLGLLRYLFDQGLARDVDEAEGGVGALAMALAAGHARCAAVLWAHGADAFLGAVEGPPGAPRLRRLEEEKEGEDRRHRPDEEGADGSRNEGGQRPRKAIPPALAAAQARSSKGLGVLAELEPLALAAADADGVTALHVACEVGCAPCVRLLLRAQEDGRLGARRWTERLDAVAEASALHAAAQGGNQAVVEELLHYGWNPDAIDKRGETPLGIALERAHLDVARVLVARGASLKLPFKLTPRLRKNLSRDAKVLVNELRNSESFKKMNRQQSFFNLH